MSTNNNQFNWDFNQPDYRSGWWFGTFFIFPYIGKFIIPIDFHIFQRGRSTTNQLEFTDFCVFGDGFLSFEWIFEWSPVDCAAKMGGFGDV